jgi:hypothetical protein
MREERMLVYFVGFEFTGDALFEIDRFRRKEGREIKPLTVREILDEEIASKWASGDSSNPPERLPLRRRVAS